MAVINIDIRANTSGSREAVNALNGALRGVGEASAQAQRANAQLGDTARRVGEDAQRQKKSWADLAVGFNQALELMNKGLQALSGAYKATVGSAVEFEKGLAEISTLYDSTTESQAKLGEEILSLQKQFGGDSQTIIKGYYDALSSGAVNATNAQDFLTAANKLAVGGATDVSTAIDGMTSVVNGFALKAEDASKISDIFFIGMKAGKTTVGELSGSIGNVAAIANSLGVSFGETVSAMSAMTLAGKTASETSTMLRQTFVELLKPGANLAKAMADAGIESAQLSIEQDGLEKTLKKIVGTTDGTAASLGKLFGSAESLSAVLSLTGAQADAFSGNLKTVDAAALNAGATTEEAFQKMASSVSFQMNVLQGKISATFTEIGVVILPYVAKALEVVIKAFEGLTQAVINGVNFYKDYKDIIDAIAVGLLAGGIAFGAYTLAINATAIATSALTAVTASFTAAIAVITSPVTLAVAAIAALTAGIYLAYKNFDLISAYAKQFAGLALKTLAPAITLVTDIFYAMKQSTDIVVASIKIMAGTYAQFASFLLSNVVKAFDVYLLAVQKVVGVFDKDLANSIANARKTIENVSNSVKNSAKAFTDSSKEQLKSAQVTEEYAKKALATDKAIKELSQSLEEGGKAELASIKAKKDSIKVEEEAKTSKDTIAQASVNATKAITDVNTATNASIPATKASVQADKESAEAKKEVVKNTVEMTDAQYAALDAHTQYAESMKQLAKETAEAEKKKNEEIKRAQEQYLANIAKIKEETDLLNATAIAEKKVAISLINNPEYDEAKQYLSTNEITKKLIEIELAGSNEEAIALKDKFQAELNLLKIQEDIAKPSLFESIQKQMMSISKQFQLGLQTATDVIGKGFSFIQGSFVGGFQGFIEGIVNAPKKILEIFSNLDTIISEFISEIPAIVDAFVEQLPKIIDSIVKKLPVLIDSIVKAIPKIFAALANALPQIINSIIQAIPRIIAAIIRALPMIISSILKAIPSFIQTLVAELPNLIEAIFQAIPEIIAAIIAELPFIIMAIIEAIPTIIMAIIKAIPTLIMSIIQQLPMLIQRGIDFLIQMITQPFRMLGELIGGDIGKKFAEFGQKVGDFFKNIFDSIGQFFINIGNFFKGVGDFFVNAFTGVVNFFKGVGDFFVNAFTGVVNFFKGIGEWFINAFNGVVNFFKGIGEWFINAFNGVVNFFRGVGEGVANFFKGIFEGVVNALKSVGSFFINIFNGIGNFFVGIFNSIGEGLRKVGDFFKDIFEGIGKFLINIGNFFKDIFDFFVNGFNGVVNFFKGIGEWFINAFNGVVNFFKGIVDFFAKIFKAVGDFISNLNPFNWFNQGGIVKGYSEGGVIQGKAFVQGDDKRNDTVMAMLSPGEIVIPRSATQGGYGAMVDYLAKLTGRTGYAQGGVIGVQRFANGGTVMNNTYSEAYLTERINSLEETIKQLGIKVVQNTLNTARTLAKFDIDGMPAVRT